MYIQVASECRLPAAIAEVAEPHSDLPLFIVGINYSPRRHSLDRFHFRLGATQSHAARDMDDRKLENNDVPAAPPTASCTSLERRLTSWCCFLASLVLNAFFRLFLWPYVSGSPYLIFIVTCSRIVIGISSLKLHQHLTGEERIHFLVHQVIDFLPIILVDFGLGSCYRDCSMRHLVSQGYCKHGRELARICRI